MRMVTTKDGGLLGHIRRMALRAETAGMSDGQLLDCFITHGDEVAFEALVRRHGPMVFGVCRRVVGDAHHAEDAFQATFLVLATKAASVLPRDAVGNWLHGVAYRTARRARAVLVRRRAREKQVNDMRHPTTAPRDMCVELEDIIDSELDALPEKYRLPVVLCDLEGRSRKAVACQLKVPEGTLSSRLATARRMLAQRLGQHGLAISGGVLAVAISQSTASAAVPKGLVVTTVKVAAAGATVAPAAVAALTKGVLKAMLFSKIKVAFAVLLVLALVSGTVGPRVQQVLAQDRQEPKAQSKPAPVKPAAGDAGGVQELAKARFRAARKAFEAVKEHYLAGARNEEEVYQWSLRTLKAQQSLGEKDLVEPLNEHVERMKELEALAVARFKKKENTADGEVVINRMVVRDTGLTAAEFYRLEAELWVAEVKVKKHGAK